MSPETMGALALGENTSIAGYHMLHGKDGELVASCLPHRLADARRLVACWNAAVGIPTTELEAAADGRLLNVFEGLVRDRDDLLAGVREANFTVRDLITKNPTMAGAQRGSTTLGNLAVELQALLQRVGAP